MIEQQNIFLQESYNDAWVDYQYTLSDVRAIVWDYVVITASNDRQAEAFKMQIDNRKAEKLLPERTQYIVIPDPDGKRVGSGGATLNVLKVLAENMGEHVSFNDKRILVVHSGGDSKRIPQYSACGKLFSPVPRVLPNGKRSTLFDEFIIALSGVPSRMASGMLVMSGDVLLLFNPLQIDFNNNTGAMAISIKAPVKTGKNHGVFLTYEDGLLRNFLHKQSEQVLDSLGAINEQNCVDIDTGAIWFNYKLVEDLYGLISTEKRFDLLKFNAFVNEICRLSFYGDFLYPLAKDVTFEQYIEQSPEGDMNDELLVCRNVLWDLLRKYSLQVLKLAPAEFIHFGTTKELLKLMCGGIDRYRHINWGKSILTTNEDLQCATSNSYLTEGIHVSANCYIEDSYIGKNVEIGNEVIISNIKLDDIQIPDGVVLHGLKLYNGKYVIRIYGINDNPKQNLLFEKNIESILHSNNILLNDIWDNPNDKTLWNAKLYPESDTIEEARKYAEAIYNMSIGLACKNDINNLIKKSRTSLCQSFNDADAYELLKWQQELETTVLIENLIKEIISKKHIKRLLEKAESIKWTDSEARRLLLNINNYDYYIQIRIYKVLSEIAKNSKNLLSRTSEEYEDICYNIINNSIKGVVINDIEIGESLKFVKANSEINMPVRVNWGGGWSDTPPYCLEFGGTVLNAAISLNGKLPVKVRVERLEEPIIVFESKDLKAEVTIDNIDEIINCHNPYDTFSLHKAALIATGVLPGTNNIELTDLLDNIGGGIKLSTSVDVPKGSGLGTSSILAAACVRALNDIFGKPTDNKRTSQQVLLMEQIMSTGGGWQDQLGALYQGIKLISTKADLKQEFKIEQLDLDDSIIDELNERFVVIYTGQKRLARNLLREIVNKTIDYDPDILNILYEIQKIAILMKFELEKGNINEFAKLLDKHWVLSKKLDPNCSNTCIEQIFETCSDLICGRFICGAGGGGFVQVILNKGIQKDILSKRLKNVFQDSGVEVWESKLYY